MKHDELIQSLKADLTEVTAPLPLGRVAVLWLVLSSVYVLTLGAAIAPFRPGYDSQLLDSPRFMLEMLMGLGAAACFLYTALAASVPGVDTRWYRRVGWLLLGGWLSQFALGFEFPTFEPSMLGKRDYCVWEAYLYSVPPLIVLIGMQRRRFVLEPVRAICFGAIASGLIPAMMMQLACMYEPLHILKFHVLPVAVLAVVSVSIAWLVARLATRPGD